MRGITIAKITRVFPNGKSLTMLRLQTLGTENHAYDNIILLPNMWFAPQKQVLAGQTNKITENSVS